MPAALRRRASADIVVGTPRIIGSVQATPNNGYQVPNGATVAVKGITLTSRNSARATVTVELLDITGAVIFRFIENGPVPAADALVVVGSEKADFLEAGDKVRVTVSAGSVDALMSFAEITP